MSYTAEQKRLGDHVARETANAYSHDAYGEKEWQKLCRMLVRAGWTIEETEAIVRSKWTRWARDAKSREQGKATDVIEFMSKLKNVKAQVAELVEGTF